MSDEENTSVPVTKYVKCRVLVPWLELPHGVAAKGRILHLPEAVFQYHSQAGAVQFIDFITK